MATTIIRPPFSTNPSTSHRGGGGWSFVGLASSFPDLLEPDGNSLAEKRSCGGSSDSDSDSAAAAGCRVFRIPRAAAATAAPPADGVEEIAPEDAGAPEHLRGMGDQVLVFKFRGKFHAVDNMCPHSMYPLSDGTPFDIEDFGVRLSSGLTCAKHGWSFDLFTGQADRGAYRLAVWQLELRPVGDDPVEGVGEGDREVWVRRKPRLG